MDPVEFPQANKVFGAPPGSSNCDDLPVMIGKLSGEDCIVSCWQPTEDEIARILVGEPVYLCIIGRGMPPVSLGGGHGYLKNFTQGW